MLLREVNLLPDNTKNLIKRAGFGSTAISSVLLTVVSTSYSQTIEERPSILSSIQRSYDQKGTIKVFAQNTNAKSCEKLMAVFGPLLGEVSRYDFAIQKLGSSSDSKMVACVEVYSDGVRSFEYFPASVFEPNETLG